MYEPNYLAHYGILGMRWGVRRYQNKDGSLTAEGRRRAGLKNESPRHKPSNARKLAKQREENLRKAREAKEAKRVFEENKTKALEKGNATEVLKFKGHLTNQELQAAFNRINLEKQLASISASETKGTWDKMDSIIEKIGKARNYTEKGIEAYNTLAKIHNSFASDSEAWKLIDGKSTTDAKKEKENKAKEKDLVDYMAKYGNLDQVTKYLDKMSTKSAKEAIKRFIPKDDEESKRKSELIMDIIVNHGGNKQIFGKIDSMSIAELEKVKDRLDKETEEERKKREKEDKEDSKDSKDA